MQTNIAHWVQNAWIDYVAGRSSAMDLAKRPVSTALISRPGESKSNQVEGPLLKRLEDKLLEDEPTNPNLGDDGVMVDIPDSLVGTHIHWSPRGLVACISENTNTRDAPDVRGFMVPKKDGTSAYTMPDMVVLERRLYEAGAKIVVLFLDEFLGTNHLTMKALTDVFLNGRFGNFSLRATTWVLGASNRAQDGAGVNRALSILTNRMNFMPVFLPIESWVAYAQSNLDMPGLMMAFAQQFPGKVTVDVPPREGAFASYRSYTFAGEWMSAYKRAIGDNDPMTLPMDGYARGKVAGFVGEGLMTELAAHSKVANELTPIKDVIKDPMGAKLPPAGRLDAAYAMAQSCIHYARPENAEPLWTYVTRLPKELQVMAAVDMLRSDRTGGMLQNSPGLNDWVAKNGALIRATQGVL